MDPSIVVDLGQGEVRFHRKLSPTERSALIRKWLKSGAYRLAPGRPPKGEDALTPIIMEKFACSLSTARRAIAAALDRPSSKPRRSPKTVRIKVDREDVDVVVTTPTRAFHIKLGRRQRKR